MRRLLLPTLVIALLVGCCAGVASARFADDAQAGPVAAPFRAPVAAPRADATNPDSWAFRSSEAIGADLQSDAPAAAATSTSGAGAAVTVTAVVLPVVIIVLDEHGGVSELVTNTEDRDAASVVYLVRVGDVSGAPASLTADTWGQARSAMAEATAGTGSIWAA